MKKNCGDLYESDEDPARNTAGKRVRTISRKWRYLILPFALTCLAVCSVAADKKQFSDAIAAVDANLKTPEGKRYDEQLGKEFGPKFGPALKECKQSSPSGSKSPFDIFLKLTVDGAVSEGLVHPETPFAVCARAALLKGKFSRPPRGEYWVNIHLELK
jgi:hypothetical protein